MIELTTVFDSIFSELKPVTEKLGFKADIPTNTEKGATPVFTRDASYFLAFSGEKGKIRILFNDNKIRLLTGEKDAASEDDSDYTLIASYLMILDEYDNRDLKSVINELVENINESFTPKQIAKRQQNVKAQATVSRAAVKNGSLFYDPATLAVRLATLYPELKDLYRMHLEKYDEFLCEDFFINNVNPRVYETLKENNPQKLKKLFSIINEIYADGTNEVQDVIIVTMLASYDLDGGMHQTVLDNLSDLVVEDFIKVYNILKSSKSARLRLENPPKYKPKKQKKKKSMMSALAGQ
ncbi:MAG: hypothetical protein IKM66_06480 [Clostridia bacterium]|nr:hypothetical protein [Clostridia bacterium]